MSVNVLKAHEQWRDRPADERFQSLDTLHAACNGYRLAAREAKLQLSKLRVDSVDGELKLISKSGQSADLTHWAMGQLCQRAKAPASYLRALPSTLAAQNLNHGLKEVSQGEGDEPASLLFRTDGKSLTLHAAVTDSYTRIWNDDICSRLIELQRKNPNWRNPMAYENGGMFGGKLVPGGLYASDQDMFAFLVDESRTLKGSPQGLNRGFFIWNSEVGASSFGIMTFLYDRVCGNNIVWGAREIHELRIRHVGKADTTVFQKIGLELRRYAESSAASVEQAIVKARDYSLGNDKAQALETLIEMAGKAKAELSMGQLREGLDVAEKREDRYGNPLSLWAAVGGITEASQASKHTDARVKTDRAAGKLLKVIEF